MTIENRWSFFSSEELQILHTLITMRQTVLATLVQEIRSEIEKREREGKDE